MAKVSRLLGKSTEISSLETLIARAAAIRSEVERLGTLDGSLSPAAYLRAVEVMPGCSPAQADTIEKAIADGPPEGSQLESAVRRFVVALRQFKPNSALKSKHLGIYIDEAADASLARLQVSRESLYLVSARHLARTYPERFGTLQKAGELDEKVAKLNAEFAELRAEIEALPLSFGTDLIVLGETREGWIQTGFACTNSEVLFTKDRAEHLVVWWNSKRQAREAA